MAEEQIIMEKNISFKVIFMSDPIRNLILSCAFGFGILLVYLKAKSNLLKITSERIVWTYGLISKTDEEIELIRIKDTSYSQDIISRIAGIGMVTIISTDTSSPRFTFPTENPKEMREKIRSLVRAEKDRRGIRYEERI